MPKPKPAKRIVVPVVGESVASVGVVIGSALVAREGKTWAVVLCAMSIATGGNKFKLLTGGEYEFRGCGEYSLKGEWDAQPFNSMSEGATVAGF